jgi:hypothetical protein
MERGHLPSTAGAGLERKNADKNLTLTLSCSASLQVSPSPYLPGFEELGISLPAFRARGHVAVP